MVSDKTPHTLFPPLLGDEDDNKKYDILSSELRSNFVQLRSLLSTEEEQSNVNTKQNENALTVCEIDTNESNKNKDKKMRHKSYIENKKRLAHSTISLSSSNKMLKNSDPIMSRRVQLAATTLITAQNEIALLYNGIAELEALLASNNQNNNHGMIDGNENDERDGMHKAVTNGLGCTVIPENHCIPGDQTC